MWFKPLKEFGRKLLFVLQAYPMPFVLGPGLPQSNAAVRSLTLTLLAIFCLHNSAVDDMITRQISTIVPCAFDTESVSLLAHDYALDVNRQTLLIDWGFSGSVEHDRLTHRLHETFEHYLFSRPVDVYFGEEAASNKVFSYDPNKIPIDPTRGPAYVQELSSFRTVHKLHPSAHATDSYTLNVLAFAIDPATNMSVNIAQFGLENLLEWFTIFSNRTQTTMGFTHHTTGGSITTEVESHVLAVKVERSGWARAFNMCIFATSWILTVGAVHFLWEHVSGWVAVVAVTLRISGVLVIATIRNLYIGTPPFGPFLDAAGFFSQITIIALSSMVWLSDPSKPRVSSATFRNIEKA